MSIEQMISKIKDAYNTRSWHIRVDRMRESQIIAIYYRLLESGKLDETSKKIKKDGGIYHQVTLEEYAKSLEG